MPTDLSSPLAAEVDAGRGALERWADEAALRAGGLPELLREQSGRWRALLAAAQIAVRVPSELLPRVLVDGRLRSQHDTQTSSARLDLDYRREVEDVLFGARPDGRSPIYGYLLGSVGGGRSSAPVRRYGNAVLVLRPRARAHTTVLAFDSLGGFSQWRDAGEPPHGCPELIDEATHRSLVRPLPSSGTSLWEVVGQHPRPFPFGYVEAQIHGGVELDDIAEVVFERVPDSDLAAAVESAGLAWRVDPQIEKAPPPRPTLEPLSEPAADVPLRADDRAERRGAEPAR